MPEERIDEESLAEALGRDAGDLYSDERARAYQTAVIHLAAVNGLNLLEIVGALSPILAVCKSIVATEIREGRERADAEGIDREPEDAGEESEGEDA